MGWKGKFSLPGPKPYVVGSMMGGQEGFSTDPQRGYSAPSKKGQAQSGWYKLMSNIAGIYYWKHIRANIWLSVYLLVELFKWLNGAQVSEWGVWLKTNWISVSPQLWTWRVAVSLALECPVGSVPRFQTAGREPQPGSNSWPAADEVRTSCPLIKAGSHHPPAQCRAQGDMAWGVICYWGLIPSSRNQFMRMALSITLGMTKCLQIRLSFPLSCFFSLQVTFSVYEMCVSCY